MLVEYDGNLRAILRKVDEFGIESYDLVAPPRRLYGTAPKVPVVESYVDCRRTRSVKSPAQLFSDLSSDDNWLSMTSRTLARLCSAFLVAEDPQRRLDVHKAATLMHQVTLVQHILDHQELRKVLIGDEVGLGKTIEAGLLINRLLEQDPNIRILYLAPARLVSNVSQELRDKLDLDPRKWSAGATGDARLESDRLVVASIHKAVFGDNFERMAKSGPWDVVIVDECHHLSDWDQNGGKPNQAFKLVTQLIKSQPTDGRLILMSGTPHQGSEARFKNLLRLISDDGKNHAHAAGRVIFRTKDRVRDWNNKPLFPSRNIKPPTIVHLGPRYENWYAGIAELYDSPSYSGCRTRATGWAKSQALQWAASSVQAGIGYLVRLSMRRLGWGLGEPHLRGAISALRPYRGGPANENLNQLYSRLQKQIGYQASPDESPEDAEEMDDEPWSPDPILLSTLLMDGVDLLNTNAADKKWEALSDIIDEADGEKIVFFAQPVETVGVVAAFLEKRYRVKPAIIIGNQSDQERNDQVALFQSQVGPRFLVSSRAGGEGLNMQRARRLVHLDVPWNPMEMEQRVGRVHRFGSRKTIIVDTVVAAGSREVDMYKIARDKLRLISKQLDPDRFEALFSRVMSLVPPKELEDLMGDGAPTPFGVKEQNEIGRLVSEGYQSWSNFNDAYREQADEIRRIEPGQATWPDLANFLLKTGSAETANNVTVTKFEFSGGEVDAIEEDLPALRIGSRVYVCGDTGGLPAETERNERASALGLNIEDISVRLRDAFLPERATGAGAVRRNKELDNLLSQSTVAIISLLRHSIRFEGGSSTEEGLSLKTYLVDILGQSTELSAADGAAVIRLLFQAQKVRDVENNDITNTILETETTLVSLLRKPTQQQFSESIRHAVWPVASIWVHPSLPKS